MMKEATSKGSIDGVTPVVRASTNDTPATIGAGSCNKKPKIEVQTGGELDIETQSAGDPQAEEKLHLPLVLTLAGAAFLNACPGLYL